MMKTTRWSLFWVGILYFAVGGVLETNVFERNERNLCRAQESVRSSQELDGTFNPPFSLKEGGESGLSSSDNLIELNGLGSFNGFGSVSKPLTVRAALVSAPKGTADKEFWRAEIPKNKAIVGFLTIKTDVADGWHIYSPTQGAGGAPTQFQISVPVAGDLAASSMLEVGSIRLATPFQTVEFLGDALEELTGSIDWVAPIFGESSDSSGENAVFKTVKIVGTVDALACSQGDGAACLPQKIDFTATFDSEGDATPILAAAENLAQIIGTDVSDLTAQNPKIVEKSEFLDASEDAAAPSKLDETQKSLPFSLRRMTFLLLSAFLGGLILNVTPCVLPVIGLKILSFFENAGRSRAKAFVLNVWYALGVSIVFGALAFASVGLSFLFTRALFQILMSAIVFAMSLSLIGVWELQTPAFLGGQKSNELIAKEGPIGAIFKGIITTLLAIPCGAPLLSPVLDWASETTRQGEIGLVVVVYLTIGVGMASPFLLAGAFPELLKFFPKPGAWMETFRKTMGFFLLIAVVWILYSAPIESQLPTTAFLFALWFACWNIGRNQFEIDARQKKIVGWAISLVVLGVVGVFSFNFPGNPTNFTLQTASENKAIRWAIRAERDGRLTQEHWKLFDRATLDSELAKGNVVAVDFTADWCMNCKFLEKTILHTPEMLELFDEKGIVALTADWTNQNADSADILEINELLDAQGARQVPTLMIFSPENPKKPIVLRGLYTKNALLAALKSVENKDAR